VRIIAFLVLIACHFGNSCSEYEFELAMLKENETLSLASIDSKKVVLSAELGL
jgi:putative component of membrane protein insertase Oxa1/YidC/SpoIIIJ protein YidD